LRAAGLEKKNKTSSNEFEVEEEDLKEFSRMKELANSNKFEEEEGARSLIVS